LLRAGATQGAVGPAGRPDTFWAVPGPGEFGHDTWEGESWKTGGAVPWIHPAVDPELGLVYWTFGNPYPRTNGSTRGGDNLFANTIVAIDAKTGKRRWHFQSVHHDIWDYDNVMAPVLIDLRIDGKLRKVVVYGSKVGMYYILDRTNGKPIQGITERPVPQDPRHKTAPTQPFPEGDPFVPQEPRLDNSTRPVPFYPTGGLFATHWDRATIIFPGAGGGADWSHVSFNPNTGWVYVGYGLINSAYSNTIGDRVNTARPYGEYFAGGLAAVDPRTNKLVWSKDSEWSLAHGNGILTTDGGVMFQGGPDGNLLAMSDTDGRELWRFQCGAGVHTSPISYESTATSTSRSSRAATGSRTRTSPRATTFGRSSSAAKSLRFFDNSLPIFAVVRSGKQLEPVPDRFHSVAQQQLIDQDISQAPVAWSAICT
jgi:glucose dehydrogenase